MAIGDSYTLNGQTRVSDAEAREHENKMFSKRIIKLPSNQQIRVEWITGSGGNKVAQYVGVGPQGLASSASGWMVQKITYDSNDNPTLIQISYGIWDNRASLTYT